MRAPQINKITETFLHPSVISITLSTFLGRQQEKENGGGSLYYRYYWFPLFVMLTPHKSNECETNTWR